MGKLACPNSHGDIPRIAAFSQLVQIIRNVSRNKHEACIKKGSLVCEGRGSCFDDTATNIEVPNFTQIPILSNQRKYSSIHSGLAYTTHHAQLPSKVTNASVELSAPDRTYSENFLLR